ncbi:DUF4827 domain-containing protein [Dysgonomonas sp. OttesenSCG-928-M03]|nr:DUF4827 domain-containing protein [Dysgonomonas sp. OttesenSCG-928-M03]
MKKITGLSLFIVCLCIIFGACNKSMSYADYVKRENNRIEDFRKERDIVILKDYPTNRAFKSNEFYLDESGVYINVVDSGNGKRAKNNDIVTFRFSGASSLPISDSDTINLVDIYHQPLRITYGVATTYTGAQSSIYAEYNFLSPGMAVPLKYVGEGAVVKLIIPFKNNMGSTPQNSYYATYYYDRVEYTAIY